jgi:hypothetical protein
MPHRAGHGTYAQLSILAVRCERDTANTAHATA